MPKILDACCGSRMFWFDKENPDVTFMDCRQYYEELPTGHVVNVNPDVVGDFRDMPFEDNEFDMVVFDPPHLIHAGENSWLAKKYGRLDELWPEDIRQGFAECMRVLRPAAKVNSNSQLYKQAGNSVTVPVIYEIAKNLELL